MRIRVLLALSVIVACGQGRETSDVGHETTVSTIPASDVPRPTSDVSIDDLDAPWRDQRGDTVRFADMKAPVRVLAMAYTNCTATCPLIVADMKKVQASVPAARRGDVRFLIVSLDPERDTPGRLAAWARETKLDESRWTLLNGDDGAVRELAATIGVRYQSLPGNEIAHTNGLTVIDADGRVRHEQQGLGAASAETVQAVRGLLDGR